MTGPLVLAVNTGPRHCYRPGLPSYTTSTSWLGGRLTRAMVQVALAAGIARAVPVVLIVALVSRPHPALPRV